MLQFRNASSLLLMACSTVGCGGGAETIEQCSARFTRLAETMPVSGGSVHGSYTFDLTKMDRDRMTQLTVDGLRGRGRPRLMAANKHSEALQRQFNAASLSPRGLLMIAGQTVLFRIPSGPHPSASDAVRHGCSLIPSAKLQAVALIAG